jgi:predicted metal-dependent peptidase
MVNLWDVTDAQQKLTKARAWLATRLPFFAVLALHLPEREATVSTATTDGTALMYNPEYVAALPDGEARGLVLHLVLHAAFGHAWRRGGREAGRWDAACDIVVNGVMRKLIGVTLPSGADAVDVMKEDWSAEEIYESLPANLEPPSTGNADGARSSRADGSAVRAFWQEALEAALQTGDAPGNVERHYPRGVSRVSWTRVLERSLRRVQHDYIWSVPDRRMLAHDLIYPSLAGEALRVAVVIDTSGSVSAELIGAFLAEVKGLRRSVPGITGLVLYADAAVSSAHDLERLPPLIVTGGGGTSFAPAFAFLEARRFHPDALVYLTDGDAEFPKKPRFPVIWVLPRAAQIVPPWGTVVRLKI